MSRIQTATIGTVVTIALVFGTAAQATFHRWHIKEVFTTADGSIQFIELYNDFSGEQFVSGHTIRAVSDGATQNLNLTANLATNISTVGKHFLVATSGFAALPGGRTPDYVIPSNFINPNAASITVSFVGVDSVTFAGSLLPKNGFDSLTDTNAIGLPPGVPNLMAGINSPTPFGASNDPGSVNLAPPVTTGDYNQNGFVDAADYTVWRDAFGQTASPQGSGSDGNSNGMIDEADYDFWKMNFGNSVFAAGSAGGAGAVVPEPALVVSLAGVAVLVLSAVRIRRPRALRQSIQISAPLSRFERLE